MTDAEIDPTELHFLILHYLAAGPCHDAAKTLEQQAVANGLLPCRHDVFGNEHRLSYSDLQHKYAHIAAEALPRLLQHALTARRAITALNLEGDHSLLTSGAQYGQVDAPGHPVKLQDLSLCHKQVLQQQGHFGSPGRRIASTQEHVQQIQHHKTIRGHKLAVYCIAFDRVGRHIITGSDDRLVKIWSVQTALLLRSCRGHDGEVTDLAINLDSTMVASSSNDTTIRCWSLEGDKLGHPVSVLVGHQGPVTYVDFNRTIPNALLSSSFDGTCRIWDATNSAWPAKVMRACPLFGPMKGITRFGGTFGPFNAGQGSKPNTRSLEAAVNARVAVPEATAGAMEHSLRSHDPIEIAGSSGAAAAATNEQEQSADQTGLLVCGFSPDGSHIVAGSNDCHIYAWFWDIASAADKGKAAAKQGFYNVVSEEDAAKNLAPPAAVDVEAGDWPEPQETCRLGGHVNDVLLLQFSHDGHCIATGSKDGTMRIWQRMRRRNKLLNNWENKHALKCELDDAVVRKAKQKRRAPPVPSVNQLAWSHDDMLIISSVSDHTIRVWDSHTGLEVQRLVGHEAQVHILECHPLDHRLAMSASYDGTTRLWNLYTGQPLASFSTKDTRPDVHSSWTDHIQLVDGHWSPDGSSLVVSDVAGQWHMYSVGAPTMVKHARYDQFLESDYDRLTRDVNNAVIDDNTQQPPHLRPTRDYLVDYVAGRYAEPYQSAYRSDQVLQLPLKVAQGEGEWDTMGLPQALREYPPTVTAAGWMAQEAEGSDEDIDRAIQRAMQRAIAAEAALAAAVVAGEVDLTAVDNEEEGEQVQAGDVEGDDQAEGAGGSRVGVGTRRSAPLRADDDVEDNMEEAEEWEQWQDGDVDTSSSDGNAMGSDSDDSMYSEGAGGARTRAQRRGRRTDKRPRPSPDRRGQRAQKRQRLQRSQYAEGGSDEEEEFEEEYEAQDGQRLLRSHRTTSRRSDAKAKKQKKKVRRQTGRAQAGAVAQGGRQLDKYAWLQVSWRTPGVYVPQLGDEVVYLQVGHRKFLSHNNNKLQGPWDSIVSTLAETRGQRMREVEPACVIALDYIISDDGTSNTCAKLRLQLSDPSSPLQGRTFDIELPPPNCGHAEFVVPKHRFLASVHRKWQVGDCCQVFYPDEDSEAAATCEAWHGDVTGVLSHDQAGDSEEVVQADPYGCGGLWERFLVGWQPRPQTGRAQDGSDEDDNTEPTHQSPWELFDEGLDAQQAVQEGPALDSPVADRLKHAVQALSASEHFELFVDLLDPDAAYPASDTGALMYYNTMVALPMSLSLVKDRLEQGYYRQVQGVMGDVATIQGNAQAFNGEDSQVAEMAADLARRLHAAAEGGTYEDGLTSDDAEFSDLDQAAAQRAHPSEQAAIRHGQKGEEVDVEDEEEDEEIDIMNSPLERPWGTDVRRSRRSNRSRRWFGSPSPSDGTAVLREGPLPHSSPSSQRQLRRHTRADAAATDGAGPSSWTAHQAGQDNAETHNGHQAAVRMTRQQAKEIEARQLEARRTAAGDHHDSDESGHFGNHAANAMLPEQRHQSHGRSMRSRRIKSQEPSSSFQINTEGDARLASDWQETYDKEQSESRLRRSRRTHAQPSSQPARSEEAAAEAAGPSQPAASLSPVSTRETRAQNRSLRGQQAEDNPSETGVESQHRLLGRHQVHVRDVSPEPAAEAAAGPAEGINHAVRRSSRAHVRVASVDVAVDKADGATQGSTGIRVTLRPSLGSARQTDEGNVAPTNEVENGRRSGLRVSLRPRRN